MKLSCCLVGRDTARRRAEAGWITSTGEYFSARIGYQYLRRSGFGLHPLVTLAVGIMLWIAFPGNSAACLGIIIVLLIAMIAALRNHKHEGTTQNTDASSVVTLQSEALGIEKHGWQTLGSARSAIVIECVIFPIFCARITFSGWKRKKRTMK